MECCARQCVVPCLPQAAAAQRDMIVGKCVPRCEDILLFLDSDEGWWSDLDENLGSTDHQGAMRNHVPSVLHFALLELE